jgi:hypothetical protein
VNRPSLFADTAFDRIDYLDHGQGRPVLVLHGSPGGKGQITAHSRLCDWRLLVVESGVPSRLR